MLMQIKTVLLGLVIISVIGLPIKCQDIDVVHNEDVEVENTESSKALKRPERLTIIAPKYLRPQNDYHVLITLANSVAAAQVDLQLTGARDSNREQTEAKSILITSGETQTIKFAIGDWPAAEYILNVTAQAIDRSWSWTQESPLVYQAKSFSGFIQTDKAIYKPGQTVQFRALFLTQSLRPVAMKDEINVTITDPAKNLIKQWTELSNYRGLLSLEMPLTEDPMLGEYLITVEARNQQVNKHFQVAEYILPTFDVDIRLPSYVTHNESDMTATVVASYTYGKPVNGHVTLTVQPLVRFYNIATRPLQQAQYNARLVNGTADIELNLVKDLSLKHESFERDIEFFALVEEDLTGRKYNKTKKLSMYDKNIDIEVINNKDKFKPGLSHTVQIKVAYRDGTPVENNGPEVELVGSLNYDRPLETVKLRPVNGIIEHTFDIPKKIIADIPDNSSIKVPPTRLNLKALYRGHRHFLDTIFAIFSDSGEFMKISLPQLQTRQQSNKKRSSPAIYVDDELGVKVETTEPLQQFTCQGIAKGDIIWALSPDAKNKTTFEFSFKVDQRMAPEGKILCFYVRAENKELIADSIRVPVNGLSRNIIKLALSREEAKPGQEVEVGVLTRPNSQVGVLGVDQSVLLLKDGNDISQKDVDTEIKSYGSSPGSSHSVSNAKDLIDEADMIVMSNNKIHTGNRFMLGMYTLNSAVASFKSLDVPQAQGIHLAQFVSEAQPRQKIQFGKPADEPLVIRTSFPETWLWENATAGADGTARFKSKVPDTITSWVLSAFSMNEAQGLALTQSPTTLRVFRPFFIKLNLPYSIIRGETVSIQAIIFNYSKRPTSARVTLENKNGEFEFVEAANNIEDEQRTSSQSESQLVRIKPEDAASVSFLITPRKLGHIDIKVIAQGDFAGDGVVRKLLVKPEGQTQHMNKAMLINLDGPQSVWKRNVSIDVPVNAVPDSSKVFVSAVGDIMGPGLSNVDDLLRLPYGCGEQNMVNLVPNIVILNYLQKTNRLKEPQRVRAIRNIETGYQRQLNYKRLDGSFSAFGEADKNGSVWLTAYVLKTLQQAKSAITVDEQVTRRAANFLSKFSRPDGSIEESGMLHHKELQSLAASGASTYLTAYSMIALLQRKITPDGEAPATVAIDEVVDRGLNYLEAQLDEAARKDSPYELAIITYALHLANRKPEIMDVAYEKLWSRAEQSDDLVWWADKSQKSLADGERSSAKLQAANETLEGESIFNFDLNPTSSSTTIQPPLKPVPKNPIHSAHLFIPDSLSIEMTSFALMSVVKRGEIDRALPIVKWLIQKQNSNGGFASTQDTVLAIEALAQFAEASLNNKNPLSIDLEFLYPRTGNKSSTFRRTNIDEMLISRNNALVNQQTRLPDNITWVQIKATGAGSAVVQVSWQYNLLVSAEKPAFYLNPILDKGSNINYIQLSVCTFYKAGEASNMALVEVELPSGYVADVEALPGLKRTKSIMRVDTSNADTKVQVYLDKVTREEICFTVPAHRVTKVSNNRPVPVTIYDYYDRHQTARIFYEPPPASSCDICDSTECQDMCSKKPKKSERLRSLHEQRNIAALPKPTPTPTNEGDRNSRLRLGNNNHIGNFGNSSVNASKLLPLAPVFKSLVSAARNIY